MKRFLLTGLLVSAAFAPSPRCLAQGVVNFDNYADVMDGSGIPIVLTNAIGGTFTASLFYSIGTLTNIPSLAGITNLVTTTIGGAYIPGTISIPTNYSAVSTNLLIQFTVAGTTFSGTATLYPPGGWNPVFGTNYSTNTWNSPVVVIGGIIPDPVDLSPANDDFAGATEIQATLLRTNFVFHSGHATSEPGEPPHRKGPALQTCWWKWTPSQPGLFRLKAAVDVFSYPNGGMIEVYTGSSLDHLKLCASSAGVPGLRVPWYYNTGIALLRVKAGQTYYIRVDDLTQEVYRGMTLDNTVHLALEPATDPLPGTIFFSLKMGGRPMARVYMPNSWTPVTSSDYRAQLYAGPSRNKLLPQGIPRSFRDSDVTSEGAGLFDADLVTMTNVVAGQLTCAQVRVWDSNYGDTFEAAMANGSLVGWSKPIYLRAGSPLVGSPVLWGIQNFWLHRP
ncbi:MAG: hypothetical protein U1F98_15345 [Verrucomicrobiota bacterium]